MTKSYRAELTVDGRSATPSLYELQPESSKPRQLALTARTFGSRSENWLAGLYSDGQGLYLLGRRKASWSVAAIDASTGKVVTTRRLPEVALDHVTVIPGPREWAFVETGSMMNPVPPKVSPLILVPAARIAARRIYDHG